MEKHEPYGHIEESSSLRGEMPLDIEHGLQDGAAEWTAGKQEWAIMITIAIISLMVALDATILVPVLPELALDLHGSATDAFWAGTSYLLASAVFQPFIASLSDIFGRKEMLLVSLFFFTLGTLLCAPIAKDFTILLVGRSIQGIGGGGVITLGQVVYADIVPLRQRPKYFSLVLGAWALGSVAGPLIGGVFVERLSWRWCFYINFPFCAAGFVLVPIFVKLSTEKSSFLSKLARVDWLGGFFFVGGATTLLIGLSWAGIQFAWVSAQTIVPISVGVISFVASIFWECYFAKEPFLTLSLFSSPSAIAAYAGAFCNGFILFCALYYIPLYFMAVRFTSPIESGVKLLPVTCLLLPGSIMVSILSTRTGHFRWAIWIGWAITSCGCGFLVLLEEDTATEIWAVILAIFGIGSGMVLTSLNIGIQAISTAEQSPRAAAMYAFMRSIGMTVGVAVGGTTFQNVMIAKLDELSMPAEIAKNAEAFIEELRAMRPSDTTRIGALDAYLHGLHGVFWLTTGVALLGLVMSAFIRKHSMDKTLESKFALKTSLRKHNLSTSTSSSAATFGSLSRAGSRFNLKRSSMSSSKYSNAGLKDYESLYEVDLGKDDGHCAQRVPNRFASLASIRRKPVAVETYYLYPNGARIPVGLPVPVPKRGFNQGWGSGAPDTLHPNAMLGLTPQHRISLIMQRDGWN